MTACCEMNGRMDSYPAMRCGLAAASTVFDESSLAGALSAGRNVLYWKAICKTARPVFERVKPAELVYSKSNPTAACSPHDGSCQRCWASGTATRGL